MYESHMILNYQCSLHYSNAQYPYIHTYTIWKDLVKSISHNVVWKIMYKWVKYKEANTVQDEGKCCISLETMSAFISCSIINSS